VAVGVTTIPAIHWINRPTFQQVVQLPNADHVKCYRASSGSAFASRSVVLDDAGGTRAATVLRPDTICTPADKSGEGVADPTAHLACYRLRHPATPARDVRASNQFGSQTLRLGKVRALCVPSAADGVASALDLDHFVCAKASRGSPPFSARTLTLADRFETKTTIVRRPYTICTPVGVDGGSVEHSTSALACYRIKDAGGQPRFAPRAVSVENAFGNQTMNAAKARLLCVPSSVE
jgi:hypothetical protein